MIKSSFLWCACAVIAALAVVDVAPIQAASSTGDAYCEIIAERNRVSCFELSRSDGNDVVLQGVAFSAPWVDSDSGTVTRSARVFATWKLDVLMSESASTLMYQYSFQSVGGAQGEGGVSELVLPNSQRAVGEGWYKSEYGQRVAFKVVGLDSFERCLGYKAVQGSLSDRFHRVANATPAQLQRCSAN